MVKNPSESSFVKSLGIKGGEAQVLMLHDSSSVISSDDAKFLNFLENLNIPYLTPASVIVFLLKKRAIRKEESMRWRMISKTIRLPEELSERIGYRAKKEDIDESDAIRQLIKLGLKEYAVNLYRDKKVTLREASELADLSPREMLDLLWNMGSREM